MTEAGSRAVPFSSADEPLIRVVDVARYFDVPRPLVEQLLDHGARPVVKAVDGVSFEIERGATLGLVGESGCGKSTLARVIVGLHPPTRGRIEFAGSLASSAGGWHKTDPRRRRIQMIFQDATASLDPRWRARAIIAEPIRALGLTKNATECDRRVTELLVAVGLSSNDADKYPHEFSGGQRQRISIARALAGQPKLLVCDEPTSALDVSVQAQILNVMKDLQRELGLTYLFISHNLAVVRYISHRVGVMYLGRLCEIAETSELVRAPRHPYTRLLLDTIPSLDRQTRTQAPIRGEVPDAINPPTGCTFHPRCPLANDRCRHDRPELRADGIAMVACHAIEEKRAPWASPT